LQRTRVSFWCQWRLQMFYLWQPEHVALKPHSMLKKFSCEWRLLSWRLLHVFRGQKLESTQRFVIIVFRAVTAVVITSHSRAEGFNVT
jgi:hypothetical protein